MTNFPYGKGVVGFGRFLRGGAVGLDQKTGRFFGISKKTRNYRKIDFGAVLAMRSLSPGVCPGGENLSGGGGAVLRAT